MHITEHLKKKNNQPLISIEIIPPQKGAEYKSLKETVQKFRDCGVAFTSVTSHAYEHSIEARGRDQIVRIRKKRLDTNAICIALHMELDVAVMPHMICSGFTKDETEDALINLNFFGIDNVLALRGDLLPSPLPFHIRHLKNTHAADLVTQIATMNRGGFLDKIEQDRGTNFCIGVAGYPEKHIEAPDFSSDLAFLKEKVGRGADFIITQMFFDNDYYYRFVEKARKVGIEVPIIPGIKPIYKRTHILNLPKVFHISMPKKLREHAERYTREEDIRKAGIEHILSQSLDLIKQDTPGIHFFTMGACDPTLQIIEALGINRG